MSNWGLAVYDENGETIDMSSAIPLELLEYVSIDSTKTFDQTYNYTVEEGASLLVIPTSYGDIIQTSTTSCVARPLTVTYSGTGAQLSVRVQFTGGSRVNDADGGSPFGVSGFAIFAIYSGGYSSGGWGLWLASGSSFSAITVGDNAYFYKTSGTTTFKTRQKLDNGGYHFDHTSNLNSTIGATTEDIVFWRIKSEDYCCIYCPSMNGGSGVCMYAPDYSNWQNYYNTSLPNTYNTNYGDWTDYAQTDLDYIVFSKSSATSPKGWGLVVYAQDGSVAFSSTSDSFSGKPLVLSSVVNSPTTPCFVPDDHQSVSGWGTTIALKDSTYFYTLPMLGVTNDGYSGYSIGLQKHGNTLYAGTAFLGENSVYENQDYTQGYEVNKIFMTDGSFYGFS